MSHDVFEDRLRAQLRGATEAEAAAFLDIDPTDVLGTGRRVVRRRRMAVAGGTLAAVTVLGVGSWAVLDGSADRTAPEVPATRTSAPDGVAADVVSTTLSAGQSDSALAYTVSLERASGRVTVTSTTQSRVTTDLGDIGRVPTGGSAAVYSTVSEDPFVVVGVVPADADQVLARFGGGDLGGVTTEEGALATTSWKAFLIHTEKSPADAELTGLDWASGGRVFDAAGNQLPSARIGDRTVYTDRVAGELGLVGPEGSARGPLPSDTDAGAVPHLWTATTESGKPTIARVALVLPSGAQDVQLGVTEGATLRSADTQVLYGGSGLAALAVVEGPDAVRPDVTSATWTVDGERTTWRAAEALVVPGVAGAPEERLPVETLTNPSGTRVVVSVEEAGALRLADVLTLQDAGKNGVARAGDGAGFGRALALVPARPTSVTASGSPAAAFTAGNQRWGAVPVPGTSMFLVAVRAGDDGQEVASWSTLRWTEAGGAAHDLTVAR